MKLAITGGRGRLAPMIRDYLTAEGHEVACYSRQEGDGCLPLSELTSSEPRYCHAILHCGWSGLPMTAEEDPELSTREDLPLLSTLIDANPGALVTLFSSASVYGNTNQEPATESSALAPVSAYARNKIVAEELLLHKAPQRSLVLRLSNLLGARPDLSTPQGVLPRIIHSAFTGEAFPLWGDGTATKDYIDRTDFLVALGLLLTKRAIGVYNVCAGTSHSVRELIQAVELATGKQVQVEEKSPYPWDVHFSEVSNDKLRSHFNWSPVVDLPQAVDACLEDMR